jgi:hypothetical protein
VAAIDPLPLPETQLRLALNEVSVAVPATLIVFGSLGAQVVSNRPLLSAVTFWLVQRAVLPQGETSIPGSGIITL